MQWHNVCKHHSKDWWAPQDRSENWEILTEVQKRGTYFLFFACNRKIVWSSVKFVVSSFEDKPRSWIQKCSTLGDKLPDSSILGSSFCAHAWPGVCFDTHVLGKAYFESPKSESCGIRSGEFISDVFSEQAMSFDSSWSEMVDSGWIWASLKKKWQQRMSLLIVEDRAKMWLDALQGILLPLWLCTETVFLT